MITAASEYEKLWADYRATGDIELRNKIIMDNIHIVKKIVNRIYPKYKNYNDYDDLISCGVLGLMDAVDKYDVSRGVKFETYATLRVRGEIIDHMRRLDPIPVNIRSKLKKIENAFEILEHEKGRTVSDEEVAEYLNISVKELEKTLEDSHHFNILYLDEMISDTISDSEDLSSGNELYESFEREELKNAIIEEIDKLPEKERIVINLYYYDELTLKEIALVLGLTESRISQIHSKVLIKLRSKLKNIV